MLLEIIHSFDDNEDVQHFFRMACTKLNFETNHRHLQLVVQHTTPAVGTNVFAYGWSFELDYANKPCVLIPLLLANAHIDDRHFRVAQLSLVPNVPEFDHQIIYCL